jgi:hypothetical protein
MLLYLEYFYYLDKLIMPRWPYLIEIEWMAWKPQSSIQPQLFTTLSMLLIGCKQIVIFVSIFL